MVRTRGAHRYSPHGPISVPLRETVARHIQSCSCSRLRTRLQRNLLHWPLLLFQRRLRLLSPHPGDTRLGWDLEPLLLCIRDHAGEPQIPSSNGHQARVSHRGLGRESSPPPADQSSSPQLSHIRGSHVLCSTARSDSRERQSSCQGLP